MIAQVAMRENGEPSTRHQEPSTENKAQRTEHGEQSTKNRAQRSTERKPRTGGILARLLQNNRHAPMLEPWPQAVPIVEVGMRVRTSDGRGGVVRDAEDVGGTLMYLVQLNGQEIGQFIPARTLRGVQL